MTHTIRLDRHANSVDEALSAEYTREELLDKRVVAVDYVTGTLPTIITEQGEYLGDTSTEHSAISFWRMPTELLAVQAHLSVQPADKNEVI